MIDRAIALIAARVDAHLRANFGVGEELVAVAPLTDSEGKPAAAVRNKLALFIVNIADDQMPRPGGRASGMGQMRRAPPVHLDVYFILAAAFEPDGYGEGLKLLSAALQFFQSNPVLTPQNAPEMPAGLAQLGLEIANTGNDELGQLWGNLGGRYVPSVMYKLRSVPIDADAVTAVEPLVREPGGAAEPVR